MLCRKYLTQKFFAINQEPPKKTTTYNFSSKVNSSHQKWHKKEKATKNKYMNIKI